MEVDESFVGGRATGKQGASTDRFPSMIAVENLGTQVNRKLRLGRAPVGVADVPGSKQLVDFARTTVEPGSLIRTDGARMFRVLGQEGYTHHYMSGYSSPEPGHVTLPGPHRVGRYSNGGTPRHASLPRWNASTCNTTSTSSPSGSIVAGQGPADCSSTGCCNKASTPIPPAG